MIDFHSHFLPRMDDGSRSVEESLEMLRVSLDQGVDVMAATPHFYAFREDPDSFLERRAAAFARLPLEDAPHPKLLLGAEVYYFDGMSNSESLRRLTLEGTRYILIEMPFSRWSDHMVDEVLRLRGQEVLSCGENNEMLGMAMAWRRCASKSSVRRMMLRIYFRYRVADL